MCQTAFFFQRSVGLTRHGPLVMQTQTLVTLMKTTNTTWIGKKRNNGVLSGLCLVAALAGVGSVNASTLAYWNFEGDGVTTPTDGALVKDYAARSAIQARGIAAIDVSGNGNTMFAWDNNWMKYSANVPGAIVPQTQVANSFSMANLNNFPAASTWSLNSAPTGTDLETVKPLAWTLEASIYATANNGHRTFLGREGNGVAANASAAPLYFKTLNGKLGIEFADEAGNFYSLFDTTAMSLNTWYNVAAVSDGANLSLYRDSGLGYQLIGSLGLMPGDTRLAYDDNGSTTVGDAQWGWTLGRGRYGVNDLQNQNHTDRWLGNIDEVRISNAALSPGQFLFAPVPEPTTATLFSLGLACLAVTRRRRK